MMRVNVLLLTLALVVGMMSCAVEVDPAPAAPVEHRLTILCRSGGSITNPGEGTFDYEEGSIVALAATPTTGYRFDVWSGDTEAIANLNAASTTITMNDNYSITANFVAQYILKTDSTDGGEVITPREGTSVHDVGTVVDLVAEAWEGHKFVAWTGGVNTIGNLDAASTTITMNDNYAITANFVEAHIYLDEIGPGAWGVSTYGKGIEATVTEEGLLVNVASDPVDDPQGIFGGFARSLYALEGDFDVCVDYRLITWPRGSGVRVGLIVVVPHILEKGLNVERVSWGSAESSHPPFREVYLVSESTISGITDTNDISGTLRTRREGASVSCYYSTSEGWHEIWTTEWSKEDVEIMIGVWSHEYLFGGEEASVLFGTVEIVSGLSWP